MSEEKGIKELKEAVEFVAILASAADKATQDGLGVEDVALFLPAITLAPTAFAGLDEAKLELDDLSQDELTELKKALADKLDLADDKLEGLVEKSIGLVVEIVGLVKEVGALKA